MAGRGGKRPGAGKPKGSTTTWKRGDLPAMFADRCGEIIREGLDSPNKAERKQMLALVIPYVFSRMPQRTELTGPEGGPIKFVEDLK
jgi:hypothetical protein